MGRIMITEVIGMELHPTPFGVCCVFYKRAVRIASLACQPNFANTLQVGDNPVCEQFGGTMVEAIERVKGLV
jgi:hypothetical protein